VTDRQFLIRLPWPPAVLSPNARAHWARRASAAKKYRADACLLSQSQGCRALDADRLTVEVIFCPPDRRRRDMDNLLAQIKSGLDGIADATGIDDSTWHIGIRRDEPVQGGAVLVHVTPGEDK